MINGKIYKLINKNTQEIIYVGSTKQKYLSSRMASHRRDLKTKKNQKHYQFINSIGGIDNVDIILIENYPCENNEQLRQREQYYKELYNNNIYNTKNAWFNKKNWQKKYYNENKEHIKTIRNKYLKNIKNKENNYKTQKKLKETNINSKRYYCIECDKAFVDKFQINRHNNCESHKNKVSLIIKEYLCNMINNI